MPYNPHHHHRRSIRLSGYDYTQAGAYFVTICVQEKAHLFGTVRDGEVHLNDAGRMIEHWWSALPDKFPSITTDAFVVMPNHVHGIIVINAGAHDAGAHIDACDAGAHDAGAHDAGAHIGAPLRDDHNAVRADQRVRPTLGTIMQWFKTMTTNAYMRGVHAHGWAPFERRLWQRNYYEHIVRDDADLHRVRTYVANNPKQCEQKPRQRDKHGGL